MRILIFLLSCLLLSKPAWSQVPTKKEMQEQMLNAVNELKKQITDLEEQIAEAKKNKEDDETIKQLEEQLAMLKKQVEMVSGLNKGIGKMSEKTIQQAAMKGSNGEGVPERDVKRIKTLPDKILNDAELVTFVKNIYAEVVKKISPEQRQQAEFMYNTAREKKLEDGIGNLASLCWMNNYTELALYLAGKACVNNMNNPDNLNNYAAFLTMTGGEHLAIPILQNLNKKFPGNSTILNNIGQAWYGLGDITNANRYLDSTVKIYRNHSQANQTKSEIQKSEGKTQESIESLKRSIKENYTPEKEARLNELGGTLTYDDIPFRYPVKADLLGIERFMFSIPEYPFLGGSGAEKSRLEWDDFRQKVIAAEEKIKAEREIVTGKAEAYTRRLLANPLILKPYNTAVNKTANRKLALLIEWSIDRVLALSKKMMAAGDSVNKWKEEYYKTQSTIDGCGARKGLATAFLSKANLLWQQRNAEWMSFQKQLLNARANLTLYAYTDRSLYELAMIDIKEIFLNNLRNLRCEFEVGCITEDPEKPPGKILPDFDITNCQYKTELSIPYMEKLFSIKVECNRMTTKFDLPFVKGEMQENLNTNKLIDVVKGTVEISQGFSKDIPLEGPLSAEMELKIGAFVEFTNEGITDVGIQGELSATASTTNLDKLIVMEDGTKYSVPGVSEQKLELGVGVRSSWNAGTTVSGSGMLSGLQASYK